jgi:hypothetical protein
VRGAGKRSYATQVVGTNPAARKLTNGGQNDRDPVHWAAGRDHDGCPGSARVERRAAERTHRRQSRALRGTIPGWVPAVRSDCLSSRLTPSPGGHNTNAPRAISLPRLARDLPGQGKLRRPTCPPPRPREGPPHRYRELYLPGSIAAPLRPGCRRRSGQHGGVRVSVLLAPRHDQGPGRKLIAPICGAFRADVGTRSLDRLNGEDTALQCMRCIHPCYSS